MARRRTQLIGTAFAFQAQKWRPLSALRSSVGLAIPLVLAGLTGHTAWGVLAGNGALNAALPAMNSIPARRLQVMLTVSAMTAVLAILAVLVGPHPLLSALLIALVSGSLTLYAAGGGVNVSLVFAGTTTVIVLSGLGLPPSSAPLSGLLVLAGGLVQTVLLVVVWPLSPQWRERSSVADAYHALALLAEQFPLAPDVVPAGSEVQEAWTVLGEAQVHGERPAHAVMRQALRVAEGVRSALVGYSEADAALRARGTPDDLRRATEAAARLGTVLRQVEASVRRGHPDYAAASQATLREVGLQLADDAALAGWVQLIGQLLSDLNRPPLVAAPGGDPVPPPTVWAMLSTVPRPSWNSALTRHALKYGLVLGVGTLVTRLFQVPHGYWLVLTAAVVLRQDYVTTLTRGMARLGGTLLGVLLASLVIWTTHPGPTLLAAWSLLGAFLAFALFPTGYAAFSASMTLYVVFAIAATGLAESVVVELRLALTVLGGLLALGAYLLFPTWQSVGTRQTLQDAAQAQCDYLAALLAARAVPDPARVDAASHARARARSLRLQAEATVQASVLEPSRSRRHAARALEPGQAQAALSRLNAGAAHSLSLHARLRSPLPEVDHDLAQASAEAGALQRDLDES